jgi:hypothetical protein
MNWEDRLPDKTLDGPGPEVLRRYIRLHHANLPNSREPLPHVMRRLGSNPAPSPSTQDEKLSHVPARLSLLDESQSTQFAVHLEK